MIELDERLEKYLSGEKLYGDDFDEGQINEWFRDEVEAYADLSNVTEYKYLYHELNRRHAFESIGQGIYEDVLGFGSATGEEFLPIISRIRRLTIVEPSQQFVQPSVHGVLSEYVTPLSSGVLPFCDSRFDLIACLGTLHHIANVTKVVSELFRCLRSSGTCLIREPITSMGDWTKPRPGVTRRERGIPLNYMDALLEECGFSVKRKSLCSFPPMHKFMALTGIEVYNSGLMTAIDSCLSTAFRWNYKYRRTNMLRKFAPGSVFYVLTK